MKTTPYAGLVTRAIALTVDALVINVIAVITGAVIALIGSLLGVGKPGILAVLTTGVAWLAWTALYFIAFWTVTGETPGARLLGIRVVPAGPRPLGVVRATLRFVVMMLALLPLGAGFVTVLFDDRRRGPHDMVAHTVARWTSAAGAPGVTFAAAPAPVAARAAGAASSAARAAATAAAAATAPGATAAAATAPGATAPAASAPGTTAAAAMAPDATAAAAMAPDATAAAATAPGATATVPADSAATVTPAPAPAPVVGEVVGPAADDRAGPTVRERHRLTSDQRPSPRFKSRPEA